MIIISYVVMGDHLTTKRSAPNWLKFCSVAQNGFIAQCILINYYYWKYTFRKVRIFTLECLLPKIDRHFQKLPMCNYLH